MGSYSSTERLSKYTSLALAVPDEINFLVILKSSEAVVAWVVVNENVVVEFRLSAIKVDPL